MNPRLLVPLFALTLAACDIPGMGPDPRIAQREAEGKAIGGACRYALRGIEECYQRNPKAPKTAIFDGWKEMDVYMRENKLAGQAPGMAPAEALAGDKPAEGAENSESKAEGEGEKVADKGSDKADKPSARTGEKTGEKTGDKVAGKAGGGGTEKGADKPRASDKGKAGGEPKAAAGKG